jgi:hypothetical protein
MVTCESMCKHSCCDEVRSLEEKLTAVQDGSFCTKCGWHGVPVPVHAGFAKFDWQCGNDACGYMVPPPKSAIIERLQSALTAAEKERDEHQRHFDVAAKAWASAADERDANRSEIERLRSSLHAAEEKIAALTEERGSWLRASDPDMPLDIDNHCTDTDCVRDAPHDGPCLIGAVVAIREREVSNKLAAERASLRAEVEQLRGEREEYERLPSVIEDMRQLAYRARAAANTAIWSVEQLAIDTANALAAAKMEKGS